MASEIESMFVEIPVQDGTKMDVYVSRPRRKEKGPGLILFQEAFGVNHHIRELTKRFASLGFTTAAPELFHRTAKHFEAAYSDWTSIMPHYQATSKVTLALDSTATHEWLSHQGTVDAGNLAAIGYCLGGRAAFVANATVPLRAAISYYGGGIAPDLLPLTQHLHGPMLFFWGGLDKHIPPEQIHAVTKALRAAGKNFINVEISDADHGFSCDERPSYNEKATREAQALTLSFLENNLKF